MTAKLPMDGPERAHAPAPAKGGEAVAALKRRAAGQHVTRAACLSARAAGAPGRG